MINYKDSKMLTLLSPAKKLDLEPVEIPIPPTQPVLQKDTTELVRCLKTKSAADLKALMKLSDPLAELNA
ncbi:MAG TPA: peroxide stress protein YaaA, partial [Hellea balneolensis]|nr:peroxide stress protein YaaA [Hellea balneolensis]